MKQAASDGGVIIPETMKGKWITLVYKTGTQRRYRTAVAQFLGPGGLNGEYQFSMRPLFGTTEIPRADIFAWSVAAKQEAKMPRIVREL